MIECEPTFSTISWMQSKIMVEGAVAVALKLTASISRPITRSTLCPARTRRLRSTESKMALPMVMVKARTLV